MGERIYFRSAYLPDGEDANRTEVNVETGADE